MVHVKIHLAVSVQMHKRVHLRLHLKVHLRYHFLMQQLLHKSVQIGSFNGGPDAALKDALDGGLNVALKCVP